MIDHLSTILNATASLKSEVPQGILEFIDADVSIDFAEGVEGLENQALFMHYLLQQYSPLVTGTGNAVQPQPQPLANSPSSLPRISEEIFLTPAGQELPSSGKRIPVVELVSMDPKLVSVPASSSAEAHAAIGPTILSFTAVNRASGIVQVPDHVVNLQSGSTGVEQPLTNRVIWMLSQNVQAAELRVNPPQLGPIEVRISVEGDQTKVSLITQHSMVREVMESAIPRLRDMLAESGLNSANIDVSQQDLSQRRDEASRYLSLRQEDFDSSEDHFASNKGLDNIQKSTVGLGLIDYYI